VIFTTSIHKKHPQSGGVVQYPVRTRGYFEIYGVRTENLGGGWASADVFRTRGKGSIFRDFVRTSFMDGPLTESRSSTKALTRKTFWIFRQTFTPIRFWIKHWTLGETEIPLLMFFQFGICNNV